jgi:hypothetical protein
MHEKENAAVEGAGGAQHGEADPAREGGPPHVYLPPPPPPPPLI